MERRTNANNGRSGLSPWLVILWTAPIPVLLAGVFLYKWYQQHNDLNALTAQFIERQNRILAYDALGVAKRISDRFESAVADVKTLALIPPRRENLIRFYLSRTSKVTRYNSTADRLSNQRIPVYNHIFYYDRSGRELLHVDRGKFKQKKKKGFKEACRMEALCDADFIKAALNKLPGEIHFGKLMRWYSPKGTPEETENASWPIAFRSEKGVFVLGIDYRHIREFLYQPTFPYDPRKDVLRDYTAGNYIYVLDSENNIFIHPKYWHVTGIDKKDNQRVLAVDTDDDIGARPLNITTYRGNRLRKYFDRLLRVSFVQKGVDIFRASNIGGTIRVLSVAPIRLAHGQYRDTEIFGHVVTGCNVDHFEEPKERVMPYY